jgi:hypothetical protein
VRREGDRVLFQYQCSPAAPGVAEPALIALTVAGRADEPPATYSFPLAGLRGEIEHPVRLEHGGAVTTSAFTLTENGLASQVAIARRRASKSPALGIRR